MRLKLIAVAALVACSVALAGPALAAPAPTTTRVTIVKLALPGSTVGSVRSTEIYYDKTGNIATLCHTVAVSTPTSGSSSLSCAARTYDLSKPGDVVALYAQAIVWLYQFALNR